MRKLTTVCMLILLTAGLSAETLPASMPEKPGIDTTDQSSFLAFALSSGLNYYPLRGVSNSFAIPLDVNAELKSGLLPRVSLGLTLPVYPDIGFLLNGRLYFSSYEGAYLGICGGARFAYTETTVMSYLGLEGGYRWILAQPTDKTAPFVDLGLECGWRTSYLRPVENPGSVTTNGTVVTGEICPRLKISAGLMLR